MVAVKLRRHGHVKELLRAGADPCQRDRRDMKAPVHVAANNSDREALRILLENGADVNAPQKVNARTALHICASKESEEGSFTCLSLLLDQEGINVNAQDDCDQQTALRMATQKGHRQMVEKLLEKGADLDDETSENIVRTFPALKARIQSRSRDERERSLENVVTRLLASNDPGIDDKFVEELGTFNRSLVESHPVGKRTLLQALADHEGGMYKSIEWMLKEIKVDPNQVPEVDSIPPVFLAAKRGRVETVKLLVAKGADLTKQDERKRNILHYLLKYGIVEEDKIVDCLEYLFDESLGVKALINQSDAEEDTPLHLATRRWSSYVVRKLLEAGAKFGVKNKWNTVPLAKISPETMEKFLDECCLKAGDEDDNDKNFEITFDYAPFAPLPGEGHSEEGSGEDLEKRRPRNPDTECLWHIRQSLNHQCLFKHPVIASLLHLKWQDLRNVFNHNLRISILFVLILTWYIFVEFGGVVEEGVASETGQGCHIAFGVLSALFLLWLFYDLFGQYRDSPSNVLAFLFLDCVMTQIVVVICSFGNNRVALRVSLAIMALLLFARELFLGFASRKTHFWATLLKVGLIIITVIILVDGEGLADVNRILAAVAIVLSWGELAVLVGKHPCLTRYNTYVVIFCTIIRRFFYFLFWYASFIIAFGIGFYIMFHQQSPHSPQYLSKNDTSFDSPYLSLVKTFGMFVGGQDITKIPVKRHSTLGFLVYVFFFLFVFLIVIVLMRILTGLAVTDIRDIQDKAETHCYLTLFDNVSYMDSLNWLPRKKGMFAKLKDNQWTIKPNEESGKCCLLGLCGSKVSHRIALLT